MKKIIYTFVALFACLSSVSAQKLFSSSFFVPVPSALTYDHKPYLCFIPEDSEDKYHGTLTITDMSLNEIKTFEVDDMKRIYTEYVDNKGIGHDAWVVMLSQTLFNDDAEWEYLEPVYEERQFEYWTEKVCVAYNVKKTDGTIIKTFPAQSYESGEPKRLQICILGDNVYGVVDNYNESDDSYSQSFYTIIEYRKYLFEGETGVKAVPAMTRTISKETYDLAGRKASGKQGGIVVRDGKKMFVR